MRYEELIDRIEEVCLAHPGVESFYYGDIENMNKQHNMKYARMCLIPSPHDYVSRALMDYSFTLVYVDRLTEDRFKRTIQSQAISTIRDIISKLDLLSDELEQVFTISLSNINVYTDPQRFVDAVTGAFATITFNTIDNDPLC